jgi:hypothetical protein
VSVCVCLRLGSFQPQALQPPTQVRTSTQLLSNLQPLKQQQQEQLEQMKQLQRQIIANPTKDAFDMLISQQQNLRKQIEAGRF